MDLVTLAFLAIGVVLILVLLGNLFAKSIDRKRGAYTQRGVLFTVAERSFYGVLEQAMSKDYKIFGKVRVADVLTPNSNMNKSDWQTAFNKISSKHFDYVLCQKDTLQVVGVIELDDKSHNSKRTKNRDAFLENACEGADLILIRFKAQAGYQIDSVREHIIGLLTNGQSADEAVNVPDLKVIVTDNKDNESRLALDLKNKYARPIEPNIKIKISSSKLAKKHGIKTPELLEKMVKCRYLIVSNDVHHLTEKGKEVGGEYVEKGRLPAYFLWSEDLTFNEEIDK